MGCVSRLPAIHLIVGCTTSLPLKPLRSPDQNDDLFENRSNRQVKNGHACCGMGTRWGLFWGGRFERVGVSNRGLGFFL